MDEPVGNVPAPDSKRHVLPDRMTLSFPIKNLSSSKMPPRVDSFAKTWGVSGSVNTFYVSWPGCSSICQSVNSTYPGDILHRLSLVSWQLFRYRNERLAENKRTFGASFNSATCIQLHLSKEPAISQIRVKIKSNRGQDAKLLPG